MRAEVATDSPRVARGGNVVLVHGIFDSGAIFAKMARHLEHHGFAPHAPDLHPSSGSSGLEDLATQLGRHIDERIGASGEFDLVGFSMGGLISRYYAQRLGGAERIRRLITISTPHHGSHMAYLLGNRAARQMRPGSRFLIDLNKDLDVLKGLSVVSMWTPWDLMIIPARSSRIAVGTELTIPVKLHPLMLTDRRSLDAILRFLK
jgi:triacylglycerol lipase